ncbi:DUF552 domain-containing protein [Pseudoclavibacter chungangensis]|uniref:Cell division protein SepF n=1 Tax=Pseudoclavibacter chungangensis TaxID=587635 RepID=A0A7J5C0Z8_9MICO|nr:cell division protein SepF [Pseudoclavibacter chungangensis]KAB1660113.1 DUF552 domain-containing protein [Pseudoclavibacter chungangensis]NYJ66782.1 cell division inhibitor SepF [Pseudoclavibacter chungangensis]
MANPLRNAMVYLGLADEDENRFEDEVHTPRRAEAVPEPRQEQPQQRQTPAPVTPITPTTKMQAPTPAANEMNEILTVHPKAYKDAQVIAENFRDGIPVIINLSQMEDGEARRLIDFASGLSQGLYGKIERVTNRVFLLSPHHVAVHGEETKNAAAKESSFFA